MNTALRPFTGIQNRMTIGKKIASAGLSDKMFKTGIVGTLRQPEPIGPLTKCCFKQVGTDHQLCLHCTRVMVQQRQKTVGRSRGNQLDITGLKMVRECGQNIAIAPLLPNG